jgi:RNA-directed DNA polymerase
VIGDKPWNIRKDLDLQSKLHRKAKQEPAFRFYLLYDKVCREDILRYAYVSPRECGCARQIEALGVEVWLAGLREDLVSKTYRPDSVRRVTIPKPGGGERPLGIPTIRGPGGSSRRQDRVGADLRGGL